MNLKKRTLKIIAKNYKLDSDLILITLWDYPNKKGRFDYLKNENSVVKNKDYKLVIDILNLRQENKNKQPKVIETKIASRIIFKDYDFSSVGKIASKISYIAKEEILKIHEELVADFNNMDDPISPSGLKDKSLLDSALFHTKTSFGNNFKYPTIESAGAALIYALSNNHAFYNGNKRVSIVALLVFLDRNNINLQCDNEDELFKISLKLADHKLVPKEYLCSDAEIYEMAKWIHNNSKVNKKGERIITLKKFKSILLYFDCKILDTGKVERISKKNLFGWFPDKLISKRTISDTIADGDVIDKGLIKSIREDLQLTSDYNIDSDTFYEKGAFSSSGFIIKYKSLLRRLSKV